MHEECRCEAKVGRLAYFIKEFVQEVDYSSTESCKQLIHSANKCPTFTQNLSIRIIVLKIYWDSVTAIISYACLKCEWWQMSTLSMSPNRHLIMFYLACWKLKNCLWKIACNGLECKLLQSSMLHALALVWNCNPDAVCVFTLHAHVSCDNSCRLEWCSACPGGWAPNGIGGMSPITKFTPLGQ